MNGPTQPSFLKLHLEIRVWQWFYTVRKSSVLLLLKYGKVQATLHKMAPWNLPNLYMLQNGWPRENYSLQNDPKNRYNMSLEANSIIGEIQQGYTNLRKELAAHMHLESLRSDSSSLALDEPCFFLEVYKTELRGEATQAYADCTGRLRWAWFQEFHWGYLRGGYAKALQGYADHHFLTTRAQVQSRKAQLRWQCLK